MFLYKQKRKFYVQVVKRSWRIHLGDTHTLYNVKIFTHTQKNQQQQQQQKNNKHFTCLSFSQHYTISWTSCASCGNHSLVCVCVCACVCVCGPLICTCWLGVCSASTPPMQNRACPVCPGSPDGESKQRSHRSIQQCFASWLAQLLRLYLAGCGYVNNL